MDGAKHRAAMPENSLEAAKYVIPEVHFLADQIP